MRKIIFYGKCIMRERESKWNFLPPEYPFADQALKEQSVLYLMQKYENMSKVLDGLGIYLSSRNIDLKPT